MHPISNKKNKTCHEIVGVTPKDASLFYNTAGLVELDDLVLVGGVLVREPLVEAMAPYSESGGQGNQHVNIR